MNHLTSIPSLAIPVLALLLLFALALFVACLERRVRRLERWTAESLRRGHVTWHDRKLVWTEDGEDAP